ncbi:MAG TPA: DpnI domain-containing protein [Bacteroidia bacterium]|nr:DpnI domain-containing protein [Bacteroidia bacterium]
MNLNFDKSLAKGYSSNSQISRVLTEGWVDKNVYCPSCGNENLKSFGNNKPVADFLCNSCEAEYELKSQKTSFSKKINDGAYKTMIERIHADNNPHFFFLNYSLANLSVQNFIVIPKYYFIDDIIEKRKPLAATARRAGWIGCNILLNNIPSTGRIFLVKNGEVQNKKQVIETWAKTSFISKQSNESKGWTLEILKLIERIPNKEFKLDDVYQFENELHKKFPKNNFIKDKIRQQLQILRDKGLLEFKTKGVYRKTS